LRYDQGIVPGGKKLNLFGNFGNPLISGPDTVIADASVKDKKTHSVLLSGLKSSVKNLT
jgi:hypothetical protein